MADSVECEIDRYIASGDYDSAFMAWPGHGVIERGTRGHGDLQEALLRAVEAREIGRSLPAEITGLDLVAFTRQRVGAMVHGLFPMREREAVLALLERSVVFLTPLNVRRVIRESDWLKTA